MNTKTKQALISLILGLGLALALLGLLTTLSSDTGTPRVAYAAPGDVYCVTPGGGAYPGCDQVFTNVQAAVDAASGGEEIRAATGIYTGINAYGGLAQVVYLSKTLTIRGGYSSDFSTWDPTSNPTILDAQGQGRVLYIEGIISPTIEGLHLINGTALGLGGGGLLGEDDAGGGVFIIGAEAKFENCWISNNTAANGGGINLRYSASTLIDNVFTANHAPYGGGIFLDNSAATLEENTITDNTANYGGGMALSESAATLNNNIIINNVADDSGGLALFESAATLNNNLIADNTARNTGGLSLVSSSAKLNKNTITGNMADEGGGVVIYASSPVLNGNVIRANIAYIGGGLYLTNLSDAFLTNNIIVENEPSGMTVQGSSAQLVHNTLAYNGEESGGGGLNVTNYHTNDSSTVVLTNTILADQNVGIFVDLGNTVSAESTLWSNTTDWMGPGAILTGTHNYWGNPDFIDPTNGIYHLGPASMAIDRGITTSITQDIDGDLRPQRLAPDLGADERPAPTLTIVKSGPNNALRGEPITYTLTITNMGSITATHPVVTDVIPSGASYVSGGSLIGDVVHWTISDLEPGISNTVQLVVTATQTIINRDYGVSADGGYGATGSLAVVTLFPQGCEAYPIALHEDSMTGLQPGDSTGPVYRGTGVGNFNWLSWNPDLSSESYLIQELRNPGLSLSDFTHAQDPGDHSLNPGDWVWGVRGAANSNNLTYELARLKASGTTMRIIVWDTAMGIGADVSHHALRFILAKISDFDLSQQPQWITFTYVAEAENPEACRDFGLTLAADGAQAGLPGQGIRYIHTLTNQGQYTETASVTYTTTLADWPVSLNPISQTLGPGQAVTVTAIVTIPLGSLEGLTNVTYITAALKSNKAISATVVDTTTTGTIDLLINKSGPVTATARDLITYTLTVTNNGSLAANSIVITDAIPIGANYVGGGAQAGDVVSWTFPGLGAGNSTVAQLVVTATQTITNSNYHVSADGGYSATGTTGVVTIITPDGDLSNHTLYLPVIFKH
jgi:uncharacterized repeat protein (TIGR01451 family)